MKPQNYEKINQELRERFLKMPLPEKRLKLSWSNWCFGLEPLETSARRLRKNGISYIELHGNHYGRDLGYRAGEVRQILEEYGLKVSGICGMFSAENDLSSSHPVHRQAALDYLRRELEFGAEVGASYLLVVPGAVGRPAKYDDSEWERSVETLRLVSELFETYGIRAAIEPIRSAEVSLVHTVGDAIRYLEAVDRPGVSAINGDLYHMLSEERSIPEALLQAGGRLVNLHLADSNRRALGLGQLDLDAVLTALYVMDYTEGERFLTPEPLGPGGDPYPAMHGKLAEEELDELVRQTASYLREREEILREEGIR